MWLFEFRGDLLGQSSAGDCQQYYESPNPGAVSFCWTTRAQQSLRLWCLVRPFSLVKNVSCASPLHSAELTFFKRNWLRLTLPGLLDSLQFATNFHEENLLTKWGLSFFYVLYTTQLSLCQRSMDCLNFPPKLASDHQIFLQASQRKLMQIWGAHSTHLCLTRYIIKE